MLAASGYEVQQIMTAPLLQCLLVCCFYRTHVHMLTQHCSPAAFDLLQLMLAASGYEVQQIITLCSNSSFCSLWLVTHVYDLLRGHPPAAAIISRLVPGRGCDQQETFTLNYALNLAEHRATWHLAAEYLAWCPVYGAAALEGMLDSCPVRAGKWELCGR